MELTITDPRGCCFLSYRRSRSIDVSLLIRAMHERGVPTWRDINDLDEEHTTSELRRVLEDGSTAGAVMWITPEVADSSVIREVEAPTVMQRAGSDDPFFVIPIAAGGADYRGASDAIGHEVSLSKLEEWNIRRIKNDPVRESDCAAIADRVLERRIQAIHNTLPEEEPLSLGLFVRTPPPKPSRSWLAINWTGRFDNRLATEASWNNHLVPAVNSVVDVIDKHARDRKIVASGRPTLSAAFVLGRAFLAPRGFDVGWNQFTPGAGESLWSISSPEERVDVTAECTDHETSASDLAVLVSVNADVRQAWMASRGSFPEFRGIVQVNYADATRPPLTAGQARVFAKTVIDSIRSARDKLKPKGDIHIFMAVPAGLAFMLGQLSNTLGPVRVYEHDEVDAVGRYVLGPRVGHN